MLVFLYGCRVIPRSQTGMWAPFWLLTEPEVPRAGSGRLSALRPGCSQHGTLSPRAPQAKGGYFCRSEGGIWKQRYLPMTSFQALVKTNPTPFLLTDLFTLP